MIITRDTLAHLSRLGIQFDPDDNLTTIPPVIQQGLTIPAPVLQWGNPTTVAQRASFMGSVGVDRGPNVARAEVVLITIGIGLWDISMVVTGIADFTPAPAGNAAYVQLNDGSGNSQIIGIYFAANVPQSMSSRFLGLFTVANVSVGLSLPTTGAAQNVSVNLGIVASKLL